MKDSNNELYHYGVKGMKWGVRHDRKTAGKYFERSIKTKDGKISPGEKIAKNTKAATNSLNNINKRRRRNKSYANNNIKKMSDAELRAKINRLQMEQQYKNLSSSDTRSGYDYVSDILDTVGDVATVTGSVISTVAIISAIRSHKL